MWRTGASYDLTGNGRTALKASYSRYGLQVGIDRVTAVNPLSAGSRTVRGPTRTATASSRRRRSPARARRSARHLDLLSRADGVDWPYSDEVTAGVEQQVMRDMRVGAMFYYRTNRDQLGVRNLAVPPTRVHAVHRRPSRTARMAPTTVTVYNLAPALASAQNNIRDNDPYLDTEYKGVEFTASKRFSSRWQMVAGLTHRQERGRAQPRRSAAAT